MGNGSGSRVDKTFKEHMCKVLGAIYNWGESYGILLENLQCVRNKRTLCTITFQSEYGDAYNCINVSLALFLMFRRYVIPKNFRLTQLLIKSKWIYLSETRSCRLESELYWYIPERTD